MKATIRSLPVPLRPGRVHEVSGPGAMGFATIMAALGQGPVLWIRPAWQVEIAFPAGLQPILAPERLLYAQTTQEADSLASAEEALKDGAIPLVVIEVTKPLGLREGRRLQLAAGAGGATGLCLIPEGMGSNAAETRWHASPLFAEREVRDSTLMLWDLKKNKSGTTGAYHVRWNTKTHHIDVVSPARLGPGAASSSA